MPDLDLEPRDYRHRNHPGHEPALKPGGLRVLAVFFGWIAFGLVVAVVVNATLGPPLKQAVTWLVYDAFSSEPSP